MTLNLGEIRIFSDMMAEDAFLYCALRDLETVMASKLESTHFYHEDRADIWKSMQELYKSGKKIDTVLLMNKGHDHDLVYNISICLMSTAGRKEYENIIYDMRCRRQISLTLGKMNFALPGDISEIHTLAKGIIEIGSLGNDEKEQFSLSANNFLDSLGKQDEVICQFGYKTLDSILGGYKKGQLIIIGARPSVGKSALMGELLIRTMGFNVKSLVLNLEMTNKEITSRILCNWSEISMSKINNKENEDKIMAGISKYPNAGDFYMYDKLFSWKQIEVAIRRAAIVDGVQIVFLDHIGLVTGQPASQNRNVWLGYITWSLKCMAKEFGLSVVGLSQLNRGVDKRNDYPVLTDLRDSGNIEQDADVVLMLHRELDVDGHYNADQMDMFIRKNRNGKLGAIKMGLDLQYMKIHEAVSHIPGKK